MEAPIAPTVNDLEHAVARTRHVRLSPGGIALLLGLWALPWTGAMAQWRIIYSEAAYFVEFDPSAVRDTPPLTMAWTRVTFTEPRGSDDASYQSQAQLHAIDCASRSSTVVGMVNYSGALGQGKAVEHQTRARTEWHTKPPQPASLAAMIIDLVCQARHKP